jgi:hypothetical protein
MASSYVNDLRLNEMATGDASGTWGTTTNTNLELIAEAFSYGTEVITTNADTHTTTIADGATDPGRSMYLKYTGTLDSACTITIGPNTVSKVWIIENGTSGSQDIILSQGSGANITIPAGDTKVVYSDGAGAGAAFFDAFASINVGALTGTSLDISGDIDVDGTTNLDVVDIDGAVDMASTLTVATKVFTPFIGSASDTDTNIYFPASNQMRVLNGGVETFRTLADGSVFNEGGVDADFRVESDANANGFMLDASTSTVGVNRAAAATVALSVNATATNSSTYALEACNSSSNTKFIVRSDGYIGFYKTGNAAGLIHNTNGAITITPDAGGHFVFNEGGVDADFRVESDNEANMFVVNGGTDQVIITNSVQDDASPNYKDSLVLHNSQDGGSRILFSNGVAAELASIEGGIQGVGSDTDDGTLVFRTAKDATASEKMRIKNSGVVFNEDGLDLDFRVESDGNANMLFVDAGNNRVFIGVASGSFGAALTIENAASYNIESRRTGTGSEGHIAFNNANGICGTIFTNGSATSYNVSSDYRLKENITDANDAGDKIDAIKVRQFDWKVDGSHQDYGMVAQELITVAPEAVSLPADSEEMMGVDYSKLVPMLVKEIQSLRTRITALES